MSVKTLRTLLEATEPGQYILPEQLAFVDLLPPLGTEKLRIRLSIAHGTELDLPLTEEAVLALTASLSARAAKGG